MLNITWEQFENQVKSLCETKKGNPGWTWRWSSLEKVCPPFRAKWSLQSLSFLFPTQTPLDMTVIADKLRSKRPGFGYAVLSDWEVLLPELSRKSENVDRESVDELCEVVEDLEVEDVACEEVQPPRSQVYQLHITYSHTYRVPVLYFNGKTSGA